jgi:hypothetical protein
LVFTKDSSLGPGCQVSAVTDHTRVISATHSLVIRVEYATTDPAFHNCNAP